ncbi:MAG: hypothetical protein IJV35_00705 [Neisseriaceae bacterium]|nr:hypothetical protein [Neisseriaceae bacterium]
MFEKEFHFFMKAMYYIPMFFAIAVIIVLIWALSERFKVKKSYRIIVVVLVSFLVSLFWTIPIKQEEKKTVAKYNEQKEKYEEAKAVFDEQCKKAGEKIYRTVDNVDGIMLLKVWRENDDSDGAGYHRWVNDQMWEYAAYTASGGKFFVGIFLSKGDVYKNNKNSKMFKDFIGYQYVDVPNGEQFTHYTGEFNGQYWVDDTNNEEIISKSSARYAVTFETDVNPELRKYWVAGVTFKIIDLQNNELLAEKTVFNFSKTLGKRMHGLSWVADNMECGIDRKSIHEFVFSVLKPQS